MSFLEKLIYTIEYINYYVSILKYYLSHDIMSGNYITPCNKLINHIFCNVTLCQCVKDGKLLTFSHQNAFLSN